MITALISSRLDQLTGDGMGAWQVGWPLAGHLFGGGGLGEFGKTGGFKPKKMHGWIQEKHILKAFIPVDGSRNCVL